MITIILLMIRMCGDLSLEKQTSISRTNMNPTTEEILPEKVTTNKAKGLFSH